MSGSHDARKVGFSEAYIGLVLDPSYRNWRREFLAGSLRVHRAHLCMLAERGIVPAPIARELKRGIEALDSFSPPEHLPGYGDREAALARVEDLYFLYERALGDTVGRANAAWLHTARSRNDMDGTIFRMALKGRFLETLRAVLRMADALEARCSRGEGELTVLFTHGQPANPSTVAHYLSSILLEILQDAGRIAEATATIDECLMGACAITGTGFPVDRRRMAELLGFGGIVPNTYQAISSSRWLEEPAGALGALMSDMGRFAADLLHKASCEVGLFVFPDDLVQISSIMPQKRNPVIIEHVRIQAGMAAQACAGIGQTFRNVPFQDVNENADAPVCAFMDTMETALSAIGLFREMCVKMEADEARAAEICARFGVTTTELADTMVRELGLGFREAHGVAAAFASSGCDRAVLRARFREAAGRELPWSDAEVDAILSPERFIGVRATEGGPAPAGMAAVYEEIARLRAALSGAIAGFEARARRADGALAEAWAKLG